MFVRVLSHPNGDGRCHETLPMTTISVEIFQDFGMIT